MKASLIGAALIGVGTPAAFAFSFAPSTSSALAPSTHVSSRGGSRSAWSTRKSAAVAVGAARIGGAAGAGARGASLMKMAVVDEISAENPLKVVVAGGGVGGLMTARHLQNMGMDVTVFERTNQFRRFGGPIQLASNALSTIKAIDAKLFDELMEYFTFTGVRTCGIKDGIRTEWYSKFTAIPFMAEMNSLPYTGVIDRPDLQKVLLGLIGDGVVENAKTVKSYKNLGDGQGVEVTLEDGEVQHCDVLLGADGIWSQVRAQMWDEPLKGGSSTAYSGYTVFAGEAVYEPKDYWDVGYKVYIGPGQYFVTSDVGQGRMQWYAFLALPPGSKAREDNIKYLRDRFTGWSPEIHEALDSTSLDDVEQRDLYDRKPSIFKSWSDGQVSLMGDACHPMMPNLGQGGCQAMEDGYVVTNMLAELKSRKEIEGTLKAYYAKRIGRTAIVQGLSRLASDLIINQFDTPAKITLSPFKVDVPGGIKSLLTVMMKPAMPVIFLAQFAYLYSFHPVRFAKDEVEQIVKDAEGRARKGAAKTWADAKEDGSFGKGRVRGAKQFA